MELGDIVRNSYKLKQGEKERLYYACVGSGKTRRIA